MKTNVLIFPAGEINSVELYEALSYNVNINIYGCSSVDRHGEYIFKNYKSGLPNISEENFIDEFNKILIEWKIEFIFPTHDSVALFLAKNQQFIKAKAIVSSIETADICRDKKKTYDLFADCDFCPKQYKSFEEYPVFIKPREGQGAKGAKIINTESDIPSNIFLSDYTINEYLPGEELTVDCLTDLNGNLCVCLPRVRKRLLAGVCVAGESILASPEVLKIASEINNRLSFLGLWYFQLKKSHNGQYKLLEISTRCAGTMCLSRAKGINLPLLSVYAAQGKEISILENSYNVVVDRTLISRYKIDYDYNNVYIDYDDTIIIDNKICLNMIRFIYQCINEGKKLFLISKHNIDHNDTIEENLKKYHIDNTLFNNIINVKYNESKYMYINPNKAIFIDNSFAERKKVYDKYRIPVFDVDTVEVLLNWRL